MTADEKDLITAGFKSLNEKMDLMIRPVKQDLSDVKVVVSSHAEKIGVLELFKEGHQQHHLSEYENKKFKTESKRFYWEILAGSGVISVVLYFLIGIKA